MRLPVLAEKPAKLPCFPCPHKSVCCGWGASLTEEEHQTIRRLYGDDAVEWDDEEQEWRTRAPEETGCVFQKDNACTLHDRPEYPRICRGFPETDGVGGEYLWDKTICPEIAAALGVPPCPPPSAAPPTAARTSARP